MTSRLKAAALAGAGLVVVSAIVFLAAGDSKSDARALSAERTPAGQGHQTRRPARVGGSPGWQVAGPDDAVEGATPIRAGRPTAGEGAPRPAQSPEDKWSSAVESVESAIVALGSAGTQAERDRLTESAAAELSGVRAEMWETEEGKELYLELQRQIEE